MQCDQPSTSVEEAKALPSRRLHAWLIVVSTITGMALVGGVPAMLFATYMAAFAADDPNASGSAALGPMMAVWAIAAGFYVLLIGGISGAWIAYRKRRNRLSFGMSMLTAGPILLVGLAIAAVVVTSFVWTASIRGIAPRVS